MTELLNLEFNLRGDRNLKRTPTTLESLLQGLSDQWTSQNEGPKTWSPLDVDGHLIHGEKTDWIPRAKIILSNSDDKKFAPFDRFAMFKEGQGKSLETLLDEFSILRAENIRTLISFELSDNDFDKDGIHAAIRTGHIKATSSTRVAHDLNHIFRIIQVMGQLYISECGP